VCLPPSSRWCSPRLSRRCHRELSKEEEKADGGGGAGGGTGGVMQWHPELGVGVVGASGGAPT
jgi:hypothetical protein